jgi:phosphoserine phosphatase RsbU/P
VSLENSPVAEAKRLAAVVATGLLDTPPEAPFDRLTALAAAVLQTPFAQVTIVDDTRSYWKSCFGIDSQNPADRSDPIARSFCRHVVASGAAVVLSDVRLDARTKNNPWIEQGVRAWAGFPIRSLSGEIVGTFCVIDTVERVWSDTDLSALETLAYAASGEIQLRMLATAANRFTDDLQNSLLPTTLPHMPGLDLAGRHVPARGEAGIMGDFYDVFRSPLGVWHVAIGDVCGHGIDAAKLTALARWTMQSAATFTSDPVRILETLHGVIYRHDPDQFVSAQLVALETFGDGTLRLDLALAGHPTALVRRSDGSVQQCGYGGRLLGMSDEPFVEHVEVVLRDGDHLVLYTDGLYEGRSRGEELGPARVETALAETVGMSADAVAAVLVDLAAAWNGGGPHDDLAVIVLGPLGSRVAVEV